MMLITTLFRRELVVVHQTNMQIDSQKVSANISYIWNLLRKSFIYYTNLQLVHAKQHIGTDPTSHKFKHVPTKTAQ